MEELKSIFQQCIAAQSLIKMIFSNPRKKSLPYKKVSLRPVLLQGKVAFQSEFYYEKKVMHENLPSSEILDECMSFVIRDFKQVNIFTEKEDIQILAAKVTSPKIIRKSSTKTKGKLDHNQDKKYIIPSGQPCDFLIRLGVMGEDGTVFPKHYSKFRQINRFLEIIRDVMPHLKDARPLRIIDFGCGKAYLSFALYHYLRNVQHMDVEIVGLDLKEDVIDFCNQISADLNYEHLHFLLGDIADYTNDHADLVVTLHACDTATDFALINAVKWNSKVILSVPCCQHELFDQINNQLHHPIFKHGIIKDRFTELLTDGLRGLTLEAAGYDVSMIEFTSLEHTAKNIMIKAIKTRKKSEHSAKEYAALKEFYQVSPTIDLLSSSLPFAVGKS